jgi:hypothetical protein
MATKGGAGSRARNKERRKQERKLAAAAKKAEYRKFAAMGKEKNSFRFKRKAQILVPDSRHEINDCGNVGCRRCFPQLNPRPEHTKYAKSVRQIHIDKYARLHPVSALN